MDLVGAGRKVEDILSRYQNLVEYETDNLKREYSIDSPDSMEKAIKDIENQERLLQIGIVGRVKAGKSSLLNALLFNGENILPKAATPMTAALTQLSYGNELSSEVEFFTKEDFVKIKEAHGKYLSRLSKLKEAAFKNLKERKKKKEKGLLKSSAKLSPQEEEELNKKALRQALREINKETELSSAYDQYEKIKNSGVDIDSVGDLKQIKAENISDLSASLMEYVGSDGKYMPFTKSVDIKLPQENLEDIRIIDTPGINDPVQSREDRTRELLKYCDVTFVVSPSGQFISNEDTDLMDRITKKEGVSDVYVVASQVDTQLMGSEKEKYNGVLPKVLEGIRSSLGTHLVSTLKKLKQSSPEVGDAFDDLIEGGKDNVVHSSGICQTLKSQFEEKEKWDDGERHVWGYLTREYPDYFSDNDKNLSCANLDLLGNISKINTIVSDVR
ncbi:MAG: dynamin family protein, partial [Candidatus Muiribacteriota bacterium]